MANFLYTIVAKSRGHATPERFTTKAGSFLGARFLGGRNDKPGDEGSSSPDWARGLDLVLASVVLIFAWPIALVVAFWIRIHSKGPAIYSQIRVGRGGERFTIFKLRTMAFESSDQVHRDHVMGSSQTTRAMTKLDELGDPRLVKGANLIRGLGLDELPQLIQVIQGKMSLVGPRPCLEWEYEEIYQAERSGRFAVRPGMTGLWQVSGKNQLSFETMAELDRYYARNKSMRLDLMILRKTPLVLIKELMRILRKRVHLREEESPSESKTDLR